MNSVKPELVTPLLAVSAWKHRSFVAAQAAILKLALSPAIESRPFGYICPGDVPEDTVAEPDRHGVASNSWNMLRAAGIIERLPLSITSTGIGIYSGRIQNKRPGAKGRWTACYRLASRPLALAWLARNCPDQVPPQRVVQQEMML